MCPCLKPAGDQPAVAWEVAAYLMLECLQDCRAPQLRRQHQRRKH